MKKNKYQIGDRMIDEDGCKGRVVIYYEDGDICSIENDAAHPNPIVVEERDVNLETKHGKL